MVIDLFISHVGPLFPFTDGLTAAYAHLSHLDDSFACLGGTVRADDHVGGFKEFVGLSLHAKRQLVMYQNLSVETTRVDIMAVLHKVTQMEKFYKILLAML